MNQPVSAHQSPLRATQQDLKTFPIFFWAMRNAHCFKYYASKGGWKQSFDGNEKAVVLQSSWIIKSFWYIYYASTCFNKTFFYASENIIEIDHQPTKYSIRQVETSVRLFICLVSSEQWLNWICSNVKEILFCLLSHAVYA